MENFVSYKTLVRFSGGISGIAHHPLQYAASSTGTGNRSLFNSISLGLVGVLTRPLSGAAELVARTGQGIMSHVGWNSIPAVRIDFSWSLLSIVPHARLTRLCSYFEGAECEWIDVRK